ncbi:MAG: hypothetical protein ACRCWI_04560 [Brevinema sp.]
MMNRMLSIFLLIPTLVYSLLIVQKAKVFTEQGFLGNKKLTTTDIDYRFDNKKILKDEDQPYFMIHYNKWVDHIIYFRQSQVKDLLEAMDIYRFERFNLIDEEESISYYLGYVEATYIEESVAGLGRQIVQNPQINFSISFQQDNFYLKLAPVEKSSVKNKMIYLDAIYLDDTQLDILENFLTNNHILETLFY